MTTEYAGEERPLTDQDLDEIRQRISRARPGPWRSFVEGRDHTSGSSFIKVGEGAERQEDIEMTGQTEGDQDFIAHARQDLPMLLAEVDRLRSLNRRP